MLQRQRIDHRGSQACTHGAMAVFDLAARGKMHDRARMHPAGHPIDSKRCRSHRFVPDISTTTTISKSPKEFTMQYSYPRPR